ncbi:MAG: hypothetical protein ACXVBR_14110 [Flavisolibacter sp.]
MNKRIIMISLWIIALLALVYAIYRSTNERITQVENGRQVVYGEPQHGLILGLCIFAGICVFSSIWLLVEKREERPAEPGTLKNEPNLVKRRTV